MDDTLARIECKHVGIVCFFKFFFHSFFFQFFHFMSFIYFICFVRCRQLFFFLSFDMISRCYFSALNRCDFNCMFGDFSSQELLSPSLSVSISSISLSTLSCCDKNTFCFISYHIEIFSFTYCPRRVPVKHSISITRSK